MQNKDLRAILIALSIIAFLSPYIQYIRTLPGILSYGHINQEAAGYVLVAFSFPA